MDKNLDQVKKIKLNASNIRSILIKRNKDQKKAILKKEKLSLKKESKEKIKKKEKKIESPIKSSLSEVKKSVGSPSGGSIFDKFFEFLGLMLTGIIVNAAPEIIEKVKEVFDIVVEVFTPIQSTFNLIVGFMTGEIDDSRYDADKKRVDGVIEKLNSPGGKVDKLISKTGLLEPYIRKFTKALNMGSKGVVLAKQGGMEGFKDTKTGKFTKKEWTTSERKSYESSKITKVSDREQYTRDPESESSRDKPSNSGGQYTGQIPPAGSNAKALLNTIRFAEGTSHDQGYNTWFGGRSDMDLTSMTINQVVEEQKKRLRNGEATYGRYTSAAVGAYQMMTPEVFARAAGFDPEKTLFSPEVQDSMAIAGYMKGQARMSQAEIDAPINRKQIAKMAPVWASLPMMNGKSRYNQPVKSFDLLRQVYNKSLNNGGSTTGEGGSLSMFTQVRLNERKMAAINQPMYEDLDDEEEMVNVYIQPINTTRTVYNYQPIPV